jgi:uncharacterized protein YciI
MQFLVTGRDSTDEGALDRRLAARPDHIAICDELFKSRKLIFGVALQDDSGKMIGSSMVFDVESRTELDDLLEAEPYIQQKVWETVDVQPCLLGPTFQTLYDS